MLSLGTIENDDSLYEDSYQILFHFYVKKLRKLFSIENVLHPLTNKGLT